MTDFKHLRKGARLALVSIVWLQVNLAGHALEHDVEETDDACFTCVQFDRWDDGSVDIPADVTDPNHAFSGPESRPAAVVWTQIPRVYYSRAPPSL